MNCHLILSICLFPEYLFLNKEETNFTQHAYKKLVNDFGIILIKIETSELVVA